MPTRDQAVHISIPAGQYVFLSTNLLDNAEAWNIQAASNNSATDPVLIGTINPDGSFPSGTPTEATVQHIKTLFPTDDWMLQGNDQEVRNGREKSLRDYWAYCVSAANLSAFPMRTT